MKKFFFSCLILASVLGSNCFAGTVSGTAAPKGSINQVTVNGQTTTYISMWNGGVYTLDADENIVFMDSGGADGTYRPKESMTFIFLTNSPDNVVKLVFSFLDIHITGQNNGERMVFYNNIGNNGSNNIVGQLGGNQGDSYSVSGIINVPIISYTGILRIEWQSENKQNPGQGWNAGISSVPRAEVETLPIELTEFAAECDGNSALVSWTTATEKNNDYFVLERSNDAVNFSEIARISGAGNSLTENKYEYSDFDINGECYYRLTQVDFDGASTTSKIIALNCNKNTAEPTMYAYPNPFEDEITIILQEFDNQDAQIEVYDLFGRLVKTEKVASTFSMYEKTLQLSNLQPGTYTIRVKTSSFTLNTKVSKQ
ncbi:MAG: T9SS type A sorting domain-containing protein [Bacteroidales bacterium]|nr:T9SS type A sorting domain-containing protein [Bacteroidales bacterium]